MRDSATADGFLPYNSLVGTMLHELVHMVRSAVVRDCALPFLRGHSPYSHGIPSPCDRRSVLTTQSFIRCVGVLGSLLQSDWF